MRWSRVSLSALAAAALLWACKDATSVRNPCQDFIGRTHVLITPSASGDAADVGVFSLAVGGALQFHVNARTVVDATPGDLGGCSFIFGEPIPSAVEWRSTNPVVATVDAHGKVAAVAVGHATIILHVVAIDRSVSLPFTVRP